MKRTDALVQLLVEDIQNADLLEVACGAADFSLSASHYARSVSCIDLDASRLNPQLLRNAGVHFQIMDASEMHFADQSFDTVVLYNALFHVRPQWDRILSECRRVLKVDGSIYVIGTWKLDAGLMSELFADRAKWQDDFLIVKLAK